MRQTLSTFSLTGFQLKWIALISMTLDHIAVVFCTPDTASWLFLKGIGRCAFPIFAFLLTEGFFHTSDHKKYCLRLLIFALISELPFDLALYQFSFSHYQEHQNIFFTLCLGMITFYILERLWKTGPFLLVLFAALSIFLAQILRFDYGGFGILVLLLFYAYHRFYPWIPRLEAFFLALIPLIALPGTIRLFPLLSLPFLFFYQGKKGEALIFHRKIPGGKYFFYWYYPLHLLFLAFLSILF